MFHVEFEGLDDVVATWGRAATNIGTGTEDVVRSAAKAGEASARVHAPHRSYELRDSIDGFVTESDSNHAEGLVVAGAPHAAAVADGSVPHEIVAKNAEALRFNVGGRTIFRKSVHHPGTKANPYMTYGEEAAEARLVSATDELIEREIAPLNGNG